MSETTDKTILRVDASPRRDNSNSRTLGDELVARLSAIGSIRSVTSRDLANGIEFIDDTWITASATPVDQLSQAQRDRLALSDELVAELAAADILIITTPIYNFSVPATLKAWIDLVARARATFRYSEEGSQGLLRDKHGILVITSGGTRLGSDSDYVSDYLRQFLGFLGIRQVDIVAADGIAEDWQASLADARRQIDALVGSRKVA